VTEPGRSGGPVGCRHCGIPVVNTVIGLMHLDPQGQLAGWLCPPQYMTLAALPEPLDPPRSSREVTPVPPAPQRRHVPDPPPQLPY